MPELYLDTNVWIDLARKREPAKRVLEWLGVEKGYIALTRFQMTEMSAAADLAPPLADLIALTRTVMVDRGRSEFSGAGRKEIIPEMFLELDLTDTASKVAFIESFQSSTFVEARREMNASSVNFRQWIERSLSQATAPGPTPWRKFDSLVTRWVIQRCGAARVEPDTNKLGEPECYQGLKLQFGVIFLRYYLGNQKWRNTDFADLMHCVDMPHAQTVVTERNLCEQIRQVKKQLPGLGPEEVCNMDWLR